MKRRALYSAVTATLGVLLIPVAADAVIFHSTGDPTFNTTAPGGSLINSGWQYQGNWGGLLGTPVGPNHFLTAGHLGAAAIGSSFIYNGVTYSTVAYPDASGYKDFGDLRLYKVDQTFHSYAPLYDAATDGEEDASGGKRIVVIGKGRQRGSEITVIENGNPVVHGWNWGAADFVQRWGENRVAAIASYAVVGDNMLLKFDFNAGVGLNEAHLAQWDSGGAAFAQVGAQWKLAGINYGVGGPYRLTEGGANLEAVLFDTGGLYDRNDDLIDNTVSDKPSAFYTSRISQSFIDIKAHLNLPPTWNLNSNGLWTTSANWANGSVPNAVGAIADFRTVISTSRLVTLNAAITAGTLNFDSASRYTLSGVNALTLDVASGSAAIHVASGSHSISTQINYNDATTLNVIPAGSTLTLSGNMNAAGQTLTKQGLGAVEVKHFRAASLAVNAGTVKVISDGGANGAGKLGTIAIAPGGKLDLTNNRLAIGATPIGTWGGSAYTGVNGLVQSGRNGAAWNGTGIISSVAAINSGLYAIGVAEASKVLNLTGTQTALWSGQTVDAGSVLLKFTYDGDANLDGVINIDDYGQIDFNAGSSGSVFGYFNGDFNLDGKINIDDYGIIDFNVSAQGVPIQSSAVSGELFADVSAIPEPAGAALIGVAAGALLRRRVRR